MRRLTGAVFILGLEEQQPLPSGLPDFAGFRSGRAAQRRCHLLSLVHRPPKGLPPLGPCHAVSRMSLHALPSGNKSGDIAGRWPPDRRRRRKMPVGNLAAVRGNRRDARAGRLPPLSGDAANL